MIRIANKTDIGRTRTLNEDRVCANENLNGFSLAIVADGMGGHQAGDIASQMAIDTIMMELEELHSVMSLDECEDLVKRAIYAANEAIFTLAATKLDYQGMGTTIVMALGTHEWLLIANIGDSRAYKINGQGIIQITEDHSLVTELLKSGEISHEEALHHPRRNVLTRALGTEPSIQVDTFKLSWQASDLILLCSDGLTGYISDTQMIEMIVGENNINKSIDRLVDEALRAGGEDNISVVLLSNENQLEEDLG